MLNSTEYIAIQDIYQSEMKVITVSEHESAQLFRDYVLPLVIAVYSSGRVNPLYHLFSLNISNCGSLVLLGK